MLIEPTPEVCDATCELMQVLARESAPIVERYSDDELELFLEFTRAGRQLQERHADWLRQKLAEGWQPPGAKAGARRRPGTRTARG